MRKYVFIKDNILLWRTLLSRSWYFMAKFPLKQFQTTLRSSREDAARRLCSSGPGCPVLGLPGWFRGLRSQHAFRSCVFFFCIFRDYMSPYFSVSHTFFVPNSHCWSVLPLSKIPPCPPEQMPSHVPSLAKTCAGLENGFCHGLPQLRSSGFNWANCPGACFDWRWDCFCSKPQESV